MLIIDGHNLIPKIPGWSLRAIDDEEKLVALLQTYARVRRRREVEVYFDGAPPGQAGARAYGSIRAVFVPASSSADEAIRRRLAELGPRSRNASVVSSDRMVQANTRSAQARVVPSEDFARDLLAAHEEAQLRAEKARPKNARGTPAQPPDVMPPGGMSPGELNDWLDLFGIDPSRADTPIEPPPQPLPKRKNKPSSSKKKRT